MSEVRPGSMNNFRLSPSGLGRLELPKHILHIIIEFAHAYSRLEAKAILTGKRARVEKCLSKLTKPEHVQVYAYKQPAILNRVQSLAATSQRLYTLCRQRLWKHIEFPTSIPIFMSHWIYDILPRHGECVDSITMGLSESWFGEMNSSTATPAKCDNTAEFDHYARFQRVWKHQCLSPENAMKVLMKCPQLTALKIICPTSSPYHDYAKPLEDRLAGIVAHLPRLRHLEITSTFPLLNHCKSKIVESSPLLESFISSGILCDSTPDSKNLLGFALSKCKRLTRLELHCSEFSIDFPGSEEAWPGSITDLRLKSCGKISSLDLKKLVCRLAPLLTRLELYFETRGSVSAPNEGALSDNPTFLPASLGDLPSTLQFLKIVNHGAKGLDLGSYPHLTHLTYHGLSPSTWPIIAKAVCAASLPKLKLLDLTFSGDFELSEWELIGAQEALHELCLREGIEPRVVSQGWLVWT